MPTFSRFSILVRLRRPHEPSSRLHRADPPRVTSRQVDRVEEESDEKVRLASRKGPQSAESARISTPSTTRFWICYIYLYRYQVLVQ